MEKSIEGQTMKQQNTEQQPMEQENVEQQLVEQFAGQQTADRQEMEQTTDYTDQSCEKKEDTVDLKLDRYIREQFQIPDVDVRTYSPLTLAFIGDGIYDLISRSKRGRLSPGKKCEISYDGEKCNDERLPPCHRL